MLTERVEELEAQIERKNKRIDELEAKLTEYKRFAGSEFVAIRGCIIADIEGR